MLVDAVEGTVVEGDVPFVAGPGGIGPPFAGGFPWAGGVKDSAFDAGGVDVFRGEFDEADAGFESGAEDTNDEAEDIALRLAGCMFGGREIQS